jgi:hypothetical protein
LGKERELSEEYPVDSQSTGKREPIPRQTLAEWITDICKVRECRDGFVSKEIQGYSTLFACPACDRYKRDLYPYQAIPTAKKWTGTVELYTETEMENRRKERRLRAEQLRSRAARTIDWAKAVERTGDPF